MSYTNEGGAVHFSTVDSEDVPVKVTTTLMTIKRSDPTPAINALSVFSSICVAEAIDCGVSPTSYSDISGLEGTDAIKSTAIGTEVSSATHSTASQTSAIAFLETGSGYSVIATKIMKATTNTTNMQYSSIIDPVSISTLKVAMTSLPTTPGSTTTPSLTTPTPTPSSNSAEYNTSITPDGCPVITYTDHSSTILGTQYLSLKSGSFLVASTCGKTLL
ncbi:MAG: hypothetical protein M1820_008865 [Bogoriella megaspora]|nr:MAG: hypothetical protein M1820_008865 [Bogoriella megaspora]